MNPNRLPKQVLYGELSTGNRNCGGQREHFKDYLKYNLKKCQIHNNDRE